MVLLAVQEAADGAGRWLGGFCLEARVDELGAAAVARVAAVCAAQTALLGRAAPLVAAAAEAATTAAAAPTATTAATTTSTTTADADANDAVVAIAARALRLAFPERLAGRQGAVDAALVAALVAELPRAGGGVAETMSDKADGVVAPATPASPSAPGALWWAKALVDPALPLSARLGRNSKATLKVFFSPRPDSDFAAVQAAADAAAVADAAAPFSSFLAAQPAPGPEAAAGQSGASPLASVSGSRKRSAQQAGLPVGTPGAAPVDLSFMLSARGRGPGAGDEEEGWRLPPERLAMLERSGPLLAQLRDDRLVAVLAQIERASDPFVALQQGLDRDPAMAGFIDLVLETIGAQRKIEAADGTVRVESCVNDLLKPSKPAFLKAALAEAKAEAEADDDGGDSDGDNEAEAADQADDDGGDNEANAADLAQAAVSEQRRTTHPAAAQADADADAGYSGDDANDGSGDSATYTIVRDMLR
jgi:hypothetical protein